MTKKLKIIAGCAIGMIWLIVHAFSPVVSVQVLNQIQNGTSSVEVEKLLGRPWSKKNGPTGAQNWKYKLPFRFAYCDLGFDEHGKLCARNYEEF